MSPENLSSLQSPRLAAAAKRLGHALPAIRGRCPALRTSAAAPPIHSPLDAPQHQYELRFELSCALALVAGQSGEFAAPLEALHGETEKDRRGT
jgi:hypothetical protein